MHKNSCNPPETAEGLSFVELKAVYEANDYYTCSDACLTEWNDLDAKYVEGKLSCGWPDHNNGEAPLATASVILCLCRANCTSSIGCHWKPASECDKAAGNLRKLCAGARLLRTACLGPRMINPLLPNPLPTPSRRRL
jgi:hypothetical protein